MVRLRLDRLAIAALLALVAVPGTAEPSPASLTVLIHGAGSAKGVIRLALCPVSAPFPDCGKAAVRVVAIPLHNGQAHTVLSGIAPGTYAISVFHDANDNGKLDTMLGIPKEGYGFSGNPSFKPRAPRFSECAISVAGAAKETIKLRYIL